MLYNFFSDYKMYLIRTNCMCKWPLLVAQMVKNLLQCRKLRSNPWVRKIPWRRAGYSLQYSWLENSMDRGAWQAAIHGITELDMTDRLTLSLFSPHMFIYNDNGKKKKKKKTLRTMVGIFRKGKITFLWVLKNSSSWESAILSLK